MKDDAALLADFCATCIFLHHHGGDCATIFRIIIDQQISVVARILCAQTIFC